MSQIQNYLAKSLDIQSDCLLNKVSKEEAIQKIAELKDSIDPIENSETIQAFIQKVEEGIQDYEPALESVGILNDQDSETTQLPMRYVPETLEGHVEPLPFHFNGLVHGAMIKKKDYNIFCYAHRWFYHKSERWAKKFRASKSIYREEVAGLFEKYNKDGISLGLPTRNVTLFDNIFVNASSPSYLNKNCVSLLKHYGPPKRRHLEMENEWFYLPLEEENANYFNDSTVHSMTNDLIRNELPYTGDGAPTKIVHKDNGIPNPFLMGKNFDKTFKKDEVELTSDAFLSKVDALIFSKATSGFVVNSPYIKVFSLSQDNPETIVSILNTWRDCSHSFYKGSGERKIVSGSNWQTFLIK